MKALVIDFSRVLLFAKREGVESLNKHHKELEATEPDYEFLEHFELNDELLGYLKKLKDRLPIYMFTDGYLHDLPEVETRLGDTFKHIYTVEELGLSKREPASYQALAAKLGYEPVEMGFVDDKPGNAQAADRAGLRVLRYETNGGLIRWLEQELG